MKIDDVKRILVVGAGQMGAQIAMQSALHGYAITLNDLTMDVLQKGMAGNRKQLERRVQKGPLTRDQMEEAIARVRLEADLEKAARDADFVIEAIVERLEPKKECWPSAACRRWARTSPRCRPWGGARSRAWISTPQ